MSTACAFGRAWLALGARCLAMVGGCLLATGCGGGDESEPESVNIASVVVVSGNQQTGTVGVALAETLVVQLLTASGKPATGQTVTFAVAWGQGSLYLGTVAADSQGYARESWTLGTATGVQRVDVRSITPGGAAVTWTYFTATAKNDTPARIEAVTGTQRGMQGQPLPNPVMVQVRDRFGNACEGAQVIFAPGSGGSASPGGATTNASGVASATWTLGPPLGAQVLEAHVDGIEPLQLSAWADQAPPSAPVGVRIASGDDQSMAQHLVLLPRPLAVRVHDALGNGVPGVAIVFSGGAGISYFPTMETMTDNTGTAYWRGYLHDAGEQYVIATVPGLGSVSFRVTVTPHGAPMDGVYRLKLVCSLPYCERDQFVADLWEWRWMPGPPGPGTFGQLWEGMVDPETGNTSFSEREVTCRWMFTGVMSFAPSGRAVGSGTFDHTCGGGRGTWSTERE